MQKVATDQNWHSQFCPSAHGQGPKFFYKIFLFYFVISVLSFILQALIFWKWLRKHDKSLLFWLSAEIFFWDINFALMEWKKIWAQTDEGRQTNKRIYCPEATTLPLHILVGDNFYAHF
jgi:hypothetical protein